jgi:glycerophosphoryl diester phosphodiesterase
MLRVFAHRGASGYEPENTIRSFKKAFELGVFKLELDVHPTKTPGQLIVIHDETLDRTTNGTGHVKDKTVEELQQYDAGKGEKLATLEEVLEFIDVWYKEQKHAKDLLKKMEVDIEIKDDAAEIVSKLIEAYIQEKGWSEKNFYVSSFNHNELKKFHTLQSTIRVGALAEKPKEQSALFGEKLRASFVGIDKESITKQFVDDAHKRNLPVYVYTVNEDKDILQMKKLNVDGVFTNYPDKSLLYER